MSDEPKDPIPEGVCTAPGCNCSRFNPGPAFPMYCRHKKCRHSVEWHHTSAKLILDDD